MSVRVRRPCSIGLNCGDSDAEFEWNGSPVCAFHYTEMALMILPVVATEEQQAKRAESLHRMPPAGMGPHGSAGGTRMMMARWSLDVDWSDQHDLMTDILLSKPKIP